MKKDKMKNTNMKNTNIEKILILRKIKYRVYNDYITVPQPMAGKYESFP